MRSGNWNPMARVAAYLALFVLYLLFVRERALPQISDFENYANRASDLADGLAIPEFYMFVQAPFVVAFQAGLYALFAENSILVFQICSILVLLLMVWLYTKYHGDAPFGHKLIPFLVLISLPSLLSLLPYVNTEILMAPYFILGNYLLLRLFEKWQDKGGLEWRGILVAALFFAVSQTIRPVAFYYMVFLFVGFLALQLRSNFSLIKSTVFWRDNISRMGLFFAIFFVAASSVYAFFGYGFRMQPTGDGVWSLYVGANTKSVGVYNDEDVRVLESIMAKEPGTGFTAHLKDTFKQLALERIKQNAGENIKLMPHRALKLMNPYFVSNFVMKGDRPMDGLYKIVFFLSACGVFLIYVLNAVAFVVLVFRKKLAQTDTTFVVALFAAYAYTLLHVALLEIQPRYYCHLVLLQIFLAPLGIGTTLSLLKKKT
jgi:hypothetical protein